jgi:hypothetical protein
MSLPDEIKERTGVISDLLAMVSWITGLPTPPFSSTYFCREEGFSLYPNDNKG